MTKPDAACFAAAFLAGSRRREVILLVIGQKTP